MSSHMGAVLPTHFHVVTFTTGRYRPDGSHACYYVTGAGNVVLEDGNGTQLLYAVADGDYIPFQNVDIIEVGTTATGIFACQFAPAP